MRQNGKWNKRRNESKNLAPQNGLELWEWFKNLDWNRKLKMICAKKLLKKCSKIYRRYTLDKVSFRTTSEYCYLAQSRVSKPFSFTQYSFKWNRCFLYRIIAVWFICLRSSLSHYNALAMNQIPNTLAYIFCELFAMAESQRSWRLWRFVWYK